MVLVTVASYPHGHLAQTARTHLEARGIGVVIAEDGGGVKVQVKAEAAKRATALLAELEGPTVEAVICTSCGQPMAETETRCPACGQSFAD